MFTSDLNYKKVLDYNCFIKITNIIFNKTLQF